MTNQQDNEVNKTLDLKTLSLFNSDAYFNYVYKKSERLCLAVYLMTDFLPQNDSIKDNMRRAGTELLRTSLSLITSVSPQRKSVLDNVSRLCLEIISLSKISANLGMSSLANHEVLESEIGSFLSTIEQKEKPSSTGSGFVLSSELLDNTNIGNTNLNSNTIISGERNNNDFFTEVEVIDKDENINNPKIRQDEGSISQHRHVEFDHSPKTTVVKKEEPYASPAVSGLMQKNDRQSMIISIIKEMGETSIKDISDNIKDCSEKTIQRELNNLIYGGVLKKVGERRWSKYMLI